MTATVKVKRKGQITIPIRLRVQVGLDDGDLVEARAERGKMILTPKPLVGRDRQRGVHASPAPSPRCPVAQSLEQAKKGETYGPFETHQEMTAFLHRKVKEDRSRKARVAKAHAR